MSKKILLVGANERACFSVARNLSLHNYIIDVAHWGWHEIEKSKFVKEFHVLPNLETNLDKFYTEFRDLINKNSFWLVLPVNDLAVEFLNKYKTDLEKYAIIGGINAPDIIKYSQNKFELSQACRAVGIHVPGMKLVSSMEDFAAVAPSLKYPVIAKPVSSRKIIGNRIYSFAVRKFVEREPLEDFVRERILSIPIMLQQVVDGFGIGFNFLAKDGKLIAWYMHERINEPRGGGESSYRKTLIEDKYGIVDLSTQLIQHIKWNGVGMIEYKVSEGKAYIMELNGRYWGSIELGIFTGIEIPYWQVLYIYENEKMPEQVITAKKVLFARNLRNDLLSSIKEKSVKSILKLIASVPMMLRPKERIEDSLFTDFKFRMAMWNNLRRKFVSGRRQRAKQSSISLQGSTAPAYKSFQKVLFICEGNICRSPFAEKYLKKIRPELTVASCGFQYQSSKMSPLKALRAAKELDVDLSTHISSYIGDVNGDDFDALFVMDKSNFQKLARKYPRLASKTFFLDPANIIVDPYGKTDADFSACYKQISQLLDQYFKR